jgi:hypothetical protein
MEQIGKTATESPSVVEVARLVSSLDLAAKVDLLTGCGYWTTNMEPTIGLRSIVLSDGPVGVRGQRWDDHGSATLPSPTAWAATWDEPLERWTDRDRATAIPLRRLLHDPAAGRGALPVHQRDTVTEVHTGPSQTGQLASAHADEDRKHPRRPQPMASVVTQKDRRLRRCPHALAAHDLPFQEARLSHALDRDPDLTDRQTGLRPGPVGRHRGRPENSRLRRLADLHPGPHRRPGRPQHRHRRGGPHILAYYGLRDGHIRALHPTKTAT